MGKVYSKNGCIPCRQRKKKCDEKKPVCSDCTRLESNCYYSRETKTPVRSRNGFNLDALILPSATAQVQLLRTTTFRDTSEENIVYYAPQILKMFWLPTSSPTAQDIDQLREGILFNDLVRNASVAYFSGLSTNNEWVARAGCVAYGRALNLLRTTLAKDELDKHEMIHLLIAVTFVGMKESFDPSKEADALVHWKFATILAGRANRMGMQDWDFLPRGYFTVALETILYHLGTRILYSKDVESAQRIWQQSGVCSMLDSLNPPGPDQVSNSLFLSGQYGIFQINAEVMFWLRSAHREPIDPTLLDEKCLSIGHEHSLLSQRFGLLDFSVRPTLSQRVLCQTFGVFCNVLLICILGLYKPVTHKLQAINKLTSESINSLSSFLNFQAFEDRTYISHICWIAIWPFQILLCVARSKDEFSRLVDHYATFKMFIDSAWQKRTELLFERTRSLRRFCQDHGERSADLSHSKEGLPIGFSLLCKPGGLLS